MTEFLKMYKTPQGVSASEMTDIVSVGR